MKVTIKVMNPFNFKKIEKIFVGNPYSVLFPSLLITIQKFRNKFKCKILLFESLQTKTDKQCKNIDLSQSSNSCFSNPTGWAAFFYQGLSRLFSNFKTLFVRKTSVLFFAVKPCYAECANNSNIK